MKRFFGLGVLALSLAGVPTQQAAAECHMKFNFGFNFNYCFEYHGNHHRQCHRQCQPGHHGQPGGMVAVFPEPHRPPQGMEGMQRFPPPPVPAGPGAERKQEEAYQWGYPNLGYTYLHPVSFAPQPANEAPTNYYYYAPQYYQAPSYYYQDSGFSFDR